MDETRLRALLNQAVSTKPPGERPLGRIVADSRRVGVRLRRRRRAGSAVASVASVAVLAAAVSFASGAFGNARNQSPAGHSGRSRQTAYVLTSSGAVVPVNLATMRAGRPLVTGLKGIYGPDIVAARGGRTLYVSTSRGVILPISTVTGRIRPPIRAASQGFWADPLVSTPNAEVGYVTSGRASITPIDLTTGTKLRQISMPLSAMVDVAASLNGRTLLAAGYRSTVTKTVVGVVNAASERARKPISLGLGTPSGYSMCVAVSPDGSTGYLAFVNKQPSIVVPIDVSANRPLKTIKLPRVGISDSFGAPGCSMAVTPNGRAAYVLIDQYLIPIDLMSGRAQTPIELPADSGDAPVLAIDPDGRMAYALTDAGVTPIDLATGTARPTIRVGEPPEVVGRGTYLAFSPNGRTVLAGVSGNELLLIHAATGKLLKAIQMPGLPDSIVVTR